MKLAAHSDASYLSEPKSRSQSGGHLFLSSDSTISKNNGAVLNIAHIIKHIMSSATDADFIALYIMSQKDVYIITILEDIGHKQPPTPLQTRQFNDGSGSQRYSFSLVTRKRMPRSVRLAL